MKEIAVKKLTFSFFNISTISMKYYTKTEIDVMINNGRKILLVDNNIFDVTNFEHPFNINPFDKK